jgi:hypothetical protein
MRSGSSQGFAFASLVFLIACQQPEPLTAQKAEQILRGYMFAREPVYAEVPQKVWWNAKSPKDDYDEKALRTLRNPSPPDLTVTEAHSDNGTTAPRRQVTGQGFRVLGTTPACAAHVSGLDRLQEIRRAPQFSAPSEEPTVGHAELVSLRRSDTAVTAVRNEQQTAGQAASSFRGVLPKTTNGSSTSP